MYRMIYKQPGECTDFLDERVEIGFKFGTRKPIIIIIIF
jgi:hypothetical protein